MTNRQSKLTDIKNESALTRGTPAPTFSWKGATINGIYGIICSFFVYPFSQKGLSNSHPIYIYIGWHTILLHQNEILESWDNPVFYFPLLWGQRGVGGLGGGLSQPKKRVGSEQIMDQTTPPVKHCYFFVDADDWVTNRDGDNIVWMDSKMVCNGKFISDTLLYVYDMLIANMATFWH